MNTFTSRQVMQDRIAEYHAHLKKWDAQLDQVDASTQIQYESERDGFARNLVDNWQDLTEAKYDEYMARVEASYQNLKARWDTYLNDRE